jgi:hypothetical protein
MPAGVLAGSGLSGEGYRKFWARPRFAGPRDVHARAGPPDDG